ncbi:MAG: dihydrodipicolinate synthase family protein [Saprospiraceae bacterium]|nr:MAG: dihydrodipicolinate synthase family protein [Saprospiraceae bacterium]
MEKLPEGLWPVMLTPFQEDNTLDLRGLAQLTEFYIATGADGLFANCLSSEMFQLTSEERIQVTKTVVDTVAGRIPVVSTGSFGHDIDEMASFIKKIYATGVAAVVISTSQLCSELEPEAVFKKKMEELLAKTGNIPLGLYECPVPFKRLLSPELLGWLAHTGRFLYHKDTSCLMESIQEKIAAVKGTPLSVYNAHIPTGLASLKAGARGLTPIAANLYPELFSYLVKHWREASIQAKFEATLSIMDTIIHHNYPYIAKLFLQKRGLPITSVCRVPRSGMSIDELSKLDAIQTVFEQLAFEFEIEVVKVEAISLSR